MKLTIDRRKWLRGKEAKEESSYLLHPRNKKMCCLGFYSKACGLPEDSIVGVSFPDEIKGVDLPEQMSWLLHPEIGASDDCVTLAEINDEAEKVTNVEREAQIAAIFALHDVQVRFIY